MHPSPYNPPIMQKREQQIREDIVQHKQNAKTDLALTCIMGTLGAFASAATALTIARKNTDGADFVLVMAAALLFCATLNFGILYKREKNSIKRLQNKLNRTEKQK